MAAAIDFYFDFSSPYGYLAATKIEALAAKHGRGVNWRPILLGAAMKVTGGMPLPQIPLKGDYARRDFVRSAKFHGAPFRVPSSFPISTVPAVRAFYWAQGKDPAGGRSRQGAVQASQMTPTSPGRGSHPGRRERRLHARGGRGRRWRAGGEGQDQGRG